MVRPAPPEVDVEELCDARSLSSLDPKLAGRALASRGIRNEDLLVAHGVRGGLRRLTKLLFPEANVRQREALYRVLLRRARSLSAQAGGRIGESGKAGEG